MQLLQRDLSSLPFLSSQLEHFNRHFQQLLGGKLVPCRSKLICMNIKHNHSLLFLRRQEARVRMVMQCSWNKLDVSETLPMLWELWLCLLVSSCSYDYIFSYRNLQVKAFEPWRLLIECLTTSTLKCGRRCSKTQMPPPLRGMKGYLGSMKKLKEI